MLFRALKFKDVFASMELYDPKYKTLPSGKRGAKICEFLKPFSAITTYFSGIKYHTSNVYFTQVDAAIKSVVEPEINQAVQTGHFGDTSDRG